MVYFLFILKKGHQKIPESRALKSSLRNIEMTIIYSENCALEYLNQPSQQW